MARILSIDYGAKRTGLAVSDPLQIIANGLDTIDTVKLVPWVKNYLNEEEVEHIVMGYPTHGDGTPTKLVREIERLGALFKKHFPNLTVSYLDESFTSDDAKRILLQSGAKQKKRRDKGLLDKISAVLILQDYLESKR